MLEVRGKQLDDRASFVEILLVTSELGQLDEVPGAHAVPRRQHTVVAVLRASQQFFVMVRREEEPAAGLIAEHFQLVVLKSLRGLEPARVIGRIVQRQQSVDDEGVVVEIRVQFGLARRVSAQEPAFGISQIRQ